jgi:cytochrome c553
VGSVRSLGLDVLRTLWLAKGLRDFASAVRVNAIMSPIAKALSPDDIADVSAYYSRMDAPFPPFKAPDTALVQRGEELARVGDAARRIQSCDKCHGPGGVGEPPAIPYLAGQYAHYIALTLHMWQQGYRRSSPDGMAVMAKKLDEQETAAVAAYYQKVQVVPARTEEAVFAGAIQRRATAGGRAKGPGTGTAANPEQRGDSIEVA